MHEADATTFDLSKLCGEACVAHVFISYTVSMIPVSRQVLPQALEAVGPGGRLHILDSSARGSAQRSRLCCSRRVNSCVLRANSAGTHETWRATRVLSRNFDACIAGTPTMQ